MLYCLMMAVRGTSGSALRMAVHRNVLRTVVHRLHVGMISARPGTPRRLSIPGSPRRKSIPDSPRRLLITTRPDPAASSLKAALRRWLGRRTRQAIADWRANHGWALQLLLRVQHARDLTSSTQRVAMQWVSRVLSRVMLGQVGATLQVGTPCDHSRLQCMHLHTHSLWSNTHMFACAGDEGEHAPGAPALGDAEPPAAERAAAAAGDAA